MSSDWLTCLQSEALAAPLSVAEGQAAAQALEQITGLVVYPLSLTAVQHRLYFLGRKGAEKFLGMVARNDAEFRGFEGAHATASLNGETLQTLLGPTSPANATA